jgi:DNA polymerase-3 subunit delta'
MDSLVGHEKILALLSRTAEEDRPAHAYLFTGREGIGKKSVAVIFASLLNCPDREHDVDQTCPTCRRIVREKHPDVVVERPERGIIRIEQVRAARYFFRFAPVEGRYRVLIVDDAHLMNRSAQNALLKTLEEPPRASILILISSKPALMLPTVRSRCRRIRFKPIAVGELGGLLARRLDVEPARARVLAGVACGSVARALTMDASKSLDMRDGIVQILREPAKEGMAALLGFSEKISSDRATALEAIELASTWVRDLLTEKLGAEALDPIHSDLLDTTRLTAQHHSTDALLSVHEELRKAAELIEAEINANTRLVTDLMFLRIARILHGPTMGLASSRSGKE